MKGRPWLWIFCFIFHVGASTLAAPENSGTADSDRLRQSYHRIETAYSVSRVHPKDSAKSSTLQNFMISGDVVITPEVSLTTRLPFVALSGELALTNPSLGLRAVLFEDLLKGFPTFVFFDGGIRPPLTSDKEFVFKRTDIFLGVSSLREVYHLSLRSDLRYILKLNPETAPEQYGNELTAAVGTELNTGYQFSFGTWLNYRRAGSLKLSDSRIPGHSVFILKPHFTYHHDADVNVNGTFAMPIGRQRLEESLRVFGDYTLAGIGGNTFFLTLEKKF